MKMRKFLPVVVAVLLSVCVSLSLAGPKKLSVDQVLSGIEGRYKTSGMCAKFYQEATLAGMGISDNATGSVCFKAPDKMAWKYEKPEVQEVVTDGRILWIYRKVDNQVMVGEAGAFFGSGEGASFFSDVTRLKKMFTVSFAKGMIPEKWSKSGWYALRLIPKKKRPEFVELNLAVDARTFEIQESISKNQAGDSTRILFYDLSFNQKLPDSKFVFIAPKGADVMKME